MSNYGRICEVLDFESDDKNFKCDFKMLTKKYGKEFKEYAQAAWIANETLSEEEFMKINGCIPKGYFEKVVKNPDIEMIKSIKNISVMIKSENSYEIAKAFGFV